MPSFARVLRVVTLVGSLLAGGFALAGSASAKAALPVVDKVAPATWGANGGTKVVISGSGFADVEKVTFGAKAAKVVSVKRGETITVVVPPHVPQLVPVRVKTKAGTSRLAAHGYFTYVGPPVIKTKKLAAGLVDEHYSATLQTEHRRAGTWSVIGGTLPAGLVLKGAVISGVPTTSGSETFKVRFVDVYGQSVSETLSLGVTIPSGWVAVNAPKPAGGYPQTLTNVACGVTGDCAAIGAESQQAAFGDEQMLDSLNDATWRAVTAPAPANGNTIDPNATVDAVACDPTGSCEAVGTYIDESLVGAGQVGAQQGLIETLTDGTWAAAEAAVPTDAYVDPYIQLNAVTCPTAGSCVAVGQYTPVADDTTSPLVETLSNGTWSATSPPVPSNGMSDVYDGLLSTVACSSATSCVATGDDSDGPLTETLADGHWTASVTGEPSDNTDNGSDPASGSACGPTSCVAIGTYQDSNVFTQGYVDTLENGTWTSATLPVPSNAYPDPDTTLNSVTCATDDSCIVTGRYTDSTGDSEVFVDSNASGTWNSTEASAPSDNEPENFEPTTLNSSACPAPGKCVAVGRYIGATGNSQTQARGLIETETSGGWTPEPAPMPTGQSGSLTGVACNADGTCVAIGTGASNEPIIDTHLAP